MTLQLPLGIGLYESTSFDNFVPGPNQAIYTILQQMIGGMGERSLYLYGVAGTGKSHLLQAACHHISQRGGIPAYFPLAYVDDLDVAMLEGLEGMDLVCIDDIQFISGRAEWEQAIFYTFNQLREVNVPLVMSANCPPSLLNVQLKDLVSRLSWGGVFSLKPLGVAEQLLALQCHARQRGLILSEEVATYLMRHYQADMRVLLACLNELDYLSLAEKRKLTLPLVRDWLKSRGMGGK